MTPTDIARLQQRGSATPKRSKYGNVKKQVDGETFDSSKEADYWLFLKARAAAGEIMEPQRQVSFPLFAPTPIPGQTLAVGHYVADFVVCEVSTGQTHIIDVKSPATAKNALYRWKRKHFEIQTGQTIDEV